MKKYFTFFLLFSIIAAKAQLLSWSPAFLHDTSNKVTITVNANFGNKGLLNYTTSDVYVHTGVITNLSTSSSDWKHVRTVWATTYSWEHATYIGNNEWTFSIDTTGGLRAFYGMTDTSEHIQKIAILFRSGNGSYAQRNADGSDMYIPVYDNGLYARIDIPYRQPLYYPLPEPITKKLGDTLPVLAKASQTGTFKLFFNGTLLNTVTGSADSARPVIATSGNQQIIAQITSGAKASSDTFNFVVSNSTTILPLPAGDTDGINYEPGDTSVVLVLYAPYKNNIFVLGDFNNWTQLSGYQMNITPDGQRFWIRITGLTPGTEYAYQYLIDGSLKVADYNTEKILDPNNDPYISSVTYPGLKAYPTGKTTGIVSILQTAKPAYNWQVTNFTRPDKRNLMIYELLVRDFTAAGNWQTLKDTLNYLKGLGINAIEVMPFNEFEGNSSWGYNPDFYFAPDKAYGTETALKQFIDACHQQGMAVIMDMVLNHSFGSSPMVQMYWDGVNNIPAANNPWFSQYYTHAFDVGYQFNNASAATKLFRERVIAFWLKNYHIDGYRFDLAKGFTPTNTCDGTGNNCNVTLWGNYDQNRVNIWDTLYNYQEAVSPDSYCILEMFADNSEETVEANSGMLLWGNLNSNFNQATMGYSNPSWDLSWGVYTNRGWSQPNLITYQESHDEERLMWKNEQYGNSSGSYSVKDTATGLKRNAMAAAFWAMIPGPKMLWQFGELGYDYSINTCADGVTINNNCRLDMKPIRWNYLQDVNRKNLHDVYGALLRLRTTPAYLSTFTTGTVNYNLSGALKWLNVSDGNLKVVVVGNFDVVNQTGTITLPASGTWYSYLSDTTLTAGSTSYNITLKPGEYYVLTSINLRNLALPVRWLSFSAQKGAKQTVLLNWSTAAEQNNRYFSVERSTSGSNFTAIGTVAAGTIPQGVQKYQFTDLQPADGVNYYRLKQVDRDGNYSYSTVVSVGIYSNTLWSLFPNPSRYNTDLSIRQNIGRLELVVTDLSGRICYRFSTNSALSGQIISIPASNYSSGVYLVKIISDKGNSTEKLVIP